jgi:hypothetical protein
VCFQKIYEATAPWYDAGERVARNGGALTISAEREIIGKRREKWGQSTMSSELEYASGS